MRLLLSLLLLLATPSRAATCPDVDEVGVQLVKHFEGFYPRAYLDAGVWAVGYGTRGPGIRRGTIWPEWLADDWLRVELEDIREMVCLRITTDLTSSQIAALVSFAYNVGIGRLIRSGILELVNARKFKLAARKIKLYNKSQGVTLKGLIRRRAAEAKLISGDIS